VLCRFVEGLSDEQIEELFQSARNAEYDELAKAARKLAGTPPAKGLAKEEHRAHLEVDLARLKRRLAEIVAIDFFGAPSRQTVEGLVANVEARLRGGKSGTRASKKRLF
jgi:hypothetical protein